MRPIPAIYENGLLRPLQSLPLPEHEKVYIILVTEDSQYPTTEARLRQMHAQADEWLTYQSRDALQPPCPLSPAHKARLDAELDQLLAEVDAAMSDASEEEVAALVDEAAQAIRHGA
jgi:predicted DNA-binding antitoxin AbrB/MazE fold protein